MILIVFILLKPFASRSKTMNRKVVDEMLGFADTRRRRSAVSHYYPSGQTWAVKYYRSFLCGPYKT